MGEVPAVRRLQLFRNERFCGQRRSIVALLLVRVQCTSRVVRHHRQLDHLRTAEQS